MLKIWTLIFSILFCSYLYADDSIVVELGSASGDTTWKDTGAYSSLSGKIDHDTTGGSFGVGYQKILDKGLLFGGGYQQLSVSGDSGYSNTFYLVNSSGVIIPTKMGLKTQQFMISGLYGAIGYNIETTDNLLFQPNLRLGLANRAEAMYTLYLNANVSGTEVNTSQDYSDSESGMTLGIMLPIVYKLESVNLGAQLRLGGGSLTLASGTEELKFSIYSAFQITLGFNL